MAGWCLVANRGHDSVSIWRMAAGTGELTDLKHFPLPGRIPWHFEWAGADHLLFSCQYNSQLEPKGCVGVLRFDPGTGALVVAAQSDALSLPMCTHALPTAK